MRVLAFAILVALASPAAARSHPRRQCKPKPNHNTPAPALPSPSTQPAPSAPGQQLNTEPSAAPEVSPSAGNESAVSPSPEASKPSPTPQVLPSEEASSSAPTSPAVSPTPEVVAEQPAAESPAAEEKHSPTPAEASPSPSSTPSPEAAEQSASASPSPSSAAAEESASPSETPSPSAAPSAEPTPSPEPESDGKFVHPALTDPAATGPAQWQQELVDLHNNLRARYSAPPVAWDQGLADYAANWANKCDFKHSGATTGENLAAGTGPDYTLAQEFQMWADEESLYDVNKPGYTDGTGHFTQVVWKDTTKIGCAWKTCEPGKVFEAEYGNSLILVCEYSPGGNYISQTSTEQTADWFRQNVGPKV